MMPAEVLGQVEYLHASGDVSLPAALEDVFYAIPNVEYEDLQMLTGHVVRNKPLLNIKPELLELDPAGVTCANCAVVTLDKTLTPEEIVAKLRLNCCAIVRCTAGTGSRSSGCGGQRGTDQSNGCCERRERPGHPLPDGCRIDPVRHLPLNDPPRS